MKTPAQAILSRVFPCVFALILLAAALLPGAGLVQQPSVPTLTSNAKLVLVPFHVQRGKYFAADLQPSDFILREDGHPRPFTTFEGPNTPHPTPLELILLFDSGPKPPEHTGMSITHWDPKADYEFLNNWTESDTNAILHKNGTDIRLTIYHYSGRQLERLCDATSDPREIAQAFQALLNPIPPGKGELTLAPDRHIDKPLFGPPVGDWLSESILATLKDAASSTTPARRVLIVFTDAFDGTPPNSPTDGTRPIIDPAQAANIPIDMVIMDIFKQTLFTNNTGGAGALSTVDTSKPGEAPSMAYSGLLPMIANVAQPTGGQDFVPQRLDRNALAYILSTQRDRSLSEYVVGFIPDPAPKPKKHSLDVKLASKSTGKMVGGKKDGVTY